MHRLKDKSHIVLSTDVETAFWQTSTSLYIKALKKPDPALKRQQRLEWNNSH